jgi:hypothetical protein
MSLVGSLGTAAEAADAFIKVVQELNGSRTVILHVDNNTPVELRRLGDTHSSGGFQEPPQWIIPPKKADVFSARDSAFSVGTGTAGRVWYVGAGFFFTIEWSVPFIGSNSCNSWINDDIPNRYEARSVSGVGNTKVHMRFEVSARVLEFASIAEKTNHLRSSGWNLGAPQGSETAASDNYGRFQHFQNGSVFWSPSTGAHLVHGAIRRKFETLGWERYGYPFTDEMAVPDGQGRFNHFQKVFPQAVVHGSIYWHPNLHPTDPMLAAHEVRGAIRTKWAELKWEQGFLGYPVTDELEWGGAPGGRVSEFQGGTIIWDPQNGARVKPI